MRVPRKRPKLPSQLRTGARGSNLGPKRVGKMGFLLGDLKQGPSTHREFGRCGGDRNRIPNSPPHTNWSHLVPARAKKEIRRGLGR